uniref:Uncharacterized protein n=1 Tax=Arundo donax TaxID=35708 RepID=A0A0A9ALB8_ARUDO
MKNSVRRIKKNIQTRNRIEPDPSGHVIIV